MTIKVKARYYTINDGDGEQIKKYVYVKFNTSDEVKSCGPVEDIESWRKAARLEEEYLRSRIKDFQEQIAEIPRNIARKQERHCVGEFVPTYGAKIRRAPDPQEVPT